jgi:hypothetical protein
MESEREMGRCERGTTYCYRPELYLAITTLESHLLFDELYIPLKVSHYDYSAEDSRLWDVTIYQVRFCQI